MDDNIDLLTDQQRTAVILRRTMRLVDAARQMGIGAERVRQLQSRGQRLLVFASHPPQSEPLAIPCIRAFRLNQPVISASTRTFVTTRLRLSLADTARTIGMSLGEAKRMELFVRKTGIVDLPWPAGILIDNSQ